MMDYINVTPVVDPIVNWVNVAPFEPKKKTHGVVVTHTGLSQSKNNLFDLFIEQTGPLAPTAVPEGREVSSFMQPSGGSEFEIKSGTYAKLGAGETDIDRIASQRLKLMAIKYASSAVSAEIVARLEILNGRMLDRSPRISREQVEALEKAHDVLASTQVAREERAKRLGISI